MGRWSWEGFPWKSHKGEMCLAGDLGREAGHPSSLPVPACPWQCWAGKNRESGLPTAQGSILNASLSAILGWLFTWFLWVRSFILEMRNFSLWKSCWNGCINFSYFLAIFLLFYQKEKNPKNPIRFVQYAQILSFFLPKCAVVYSKCWSGSEAPSCHSIWLFLFLPLWARCWATKNHFAFPSLYLTSPKWAKQAWYFHTIQAVLFFFHRRGQIPE